MDSSLPRSVELEVLDGIGLIGQTRIDAGILEGTGEQSTGGADERKSFLVFTIARLLTDQHERRIASTVAEYGLGGVFVQVTAAAAGGRVLQ